MKHFEEHILELYVLNSQELTLKRSEIEAHLSECHGCRELIGEMRSFHSDLAEEIEQEIPEELHSEHALIRTRADVEPYFDPFMAAAAYRPITPLGRFRAIIRRHPIKITVGTFGFAAVAAFLFAMNVSKRNEPGAIADTNPAYVHVNLDATSLEILNKEDEVLWRKKIADLSKDAGVKVVQSRAAIADLDGDGINEVITTLPFTDFRNANDEHLRIYDSKGNLRRDTLYQLDVRYHGGAGEYSPIICCGHLVVRNSNVPGTIEIFVTGNSLGRSPSVLMRLDEKLHIIGTYWHFGNLDQMMLTSTAPGNPARLFLGGLNDTADSAGVIDPVWVVIDPDRITGDKRSNACPGFQRELSDAEEYYVKFPPCDIDILHRGHGSFNSIETFSQTKTLVGITAAYESTPIGISYLFDEDMSCIEVKSSTQTDIFHQQLVDQGRLKGRIDTAYKERLRKEVRYFDGKGWRSEVVKVQHYSADTP